VARYVLGRIAQSIISILFIASLVFLLVRMTGDPVRLLLPDFAPPEFIERLRANLGLDLPLYQQYANFMGQLLRLDMGTSFSGRPVMEVLLEHLPATATLAVAALVVAATIAVPLGILSAIYKGSAIDTVARTVALLGQSVPSFWLAILLILGFGVALSWFPVAGRTGLSSYVMPAIAMGWAAVAGIVRITRSSMLEVMDSDYIRMARAKGLPTRIVYVKHGLRNAIIPVLTFAGLLVGAFMNGSVVVENVFAWPGIGKMTLDAVKGRDFPVVQGAVIMSAFFFIVINLLVDLLYAVVDPRIRYRRS
jgi:peptide/nickel transport system permease protein